MFTGTEVGVQSADGEEFQTRTSLSSHSKVFISSVLPKRIPLRISCQIEHVLVQLFAGTLLGLVTIVGEGLEKV